MGLLWFRQSDILSLPDDMEIFGLLRSPSVAAVVEDGANDGSGGRSSSSSSSAMAAMSGGGFCGGGGCGGGGNDAEGAESGQTSRFATAFSADELFSAAYATKMDKM